MEVTVMTIIWAVVFASAIFIEAETAEMTAIWFMPGALIALALSLFNVDIWIQCLVFILLSAILYKPFFKRFYDVVLSGLAIIVLSPILLILIIPITKQQIQKK